MHRHQIVGVLYDLIVNEKDTIIVVDRLADIAPILREATAWDGRLGKAKFKIYRANGAERIGYAGHWVRFASARSPRGLRGLVPAVIVVDENSPGIHLSLEGINALEASGAERVPMLH